MHSRNVIERATVLADGSKLAQRPKVEPGASPTDGGSSGWLVCPVPEELLDQPYKVAKAQLVHEFELGYLGRLVQLHGANVSRIATEAGVDRHLVRKLLRKHGMVQDD